MMLQNSAMVTAVVMTKREGLRSDFPQRFSSNSCSSGRLCESAARSTCPKALKHNGAPPLHLCCDRIYGCFAGIVVLWSGVTAGAYGDAFRTWQYLSSGVVAFVTLSALSWCIWHLQSSGPVAEQDLDRVPSLIEN